MTVHAVNVLLEDDVQAVFDSFSSCFGIRTLFFSTAGKTPSSDALYCSLVQMKLGVSLCLRLDEKKRRGFPPSRFLDTRTLAFEPGIQIS